MSTTDTVMFLLTNPKTGEEEHFWLEVTTSVDPGKHTMLNGEPGYPQEESFTINDWGKCTDDTKPDWVSQTTLMNMAKYAPITNEEDGPDEEYYPEDKYDH